MKVRYTTLIALLLTTSSFVHGQSSSFIDIDGNTYNTETIEGIIWMADNLNVQRYSNGDTIQEAKTDVEWKKCSEDKRGCWCFFENNISNNYKQGRLYNWYAVNDIRGLAPKGWHVASDDEWGKLEKFYRDNLNKFNGIPRFFPDGRDIAPTMQKPILFDQSSDIYNQSSGYRNWDGGFFKVDVILAKYFLWSTTDIDNYAYTRSLPGAPFRQIKIKSLGLSVRCIKD